MKAFRIQNDIIAALDEQAAVKAWAAHYEVSVNTAGPIENVDPATLEIGIQDEPDGEFRTGKLAEVMPDDGDPFTPCLVCIGECDC